MSQIALSENIAHGRGTRSGGWLISLMLHGGLVALAMQAVMEVKPHRQPETFRWDVALQPAPTPSPVAAEPVPSPQPVSEPPQPKKPVSRPVSQPSPAPAPQVVERTAVVQTVQATQVAPRVVERSTPQERQAVVTEVQPVASQPVHEAVAVVSQAQEVVQQDSHDMVQPVETQMVTAQSSDAVQQSAVPVETSATAVEQPAVVAHAFVETASSVAPPSTSLTEPHEEVVSDPVMVRQSAVVQREVRETAPAQADLGWLAESLWTRIEELKRYPRQARARRWEGKVVLEAVIRHDGTILECLIAESSGHGLLDQDAISVLRKASPLALKHPLGKEHITILVPIAYRLES
ncbi:MAG: TonB family protein [Nitrospira sp.]|nr:TonB family protein [Nitrospira sp.]